MGTNVIVGFTGTGLTIENAPILRYKNVLYSPLEVSTPANWGGVTIVAVSNCKIYYWK